MDENQEVLKPAKFMQILGRVKVDSRVAVVMSGQTDVFLLKIVSKGEDYWVVKFLDWETLVEIRESIIGLDIVGLFDMDPATWAPTESVATILRNITSKYNGMDL